MSPQSHSGRWIEARWLRIGDHFLTEAGKSATVLGLTIRIERVKVYNLIVKYLHLYFAGQAGVLVHNKAGFQFSHVRDLKNLSWRDVRN